MLLLNKSVAFFSLTVRPGKQQMLTSHFAQNYGAHYKYGVSVGSKSFEEAPDAVIRALLRLRWAGHQTIEHARTSISQLQKEGKVDVSKSLGFEFVEFNELLALGYFEGNKINVSSRTSSPPILETATNTKSSGMTMAKILWAQLLPPSLSAHPRQCLSDRRKRGLKGQPSEPTALSWICSCSTGTWW